MRTIYKCFPEGKFKVLTMSYDDGRDPDKKLINLFNKYKIKGSFHLNSGLLKDAPPTPNDAYGLRIQSEEIKKIYEGHEVSCHTSTHPTIARSPIGHVTKEIIEDREKLEEIVGYTVRGLSYPNGSFSDEIKAMLPSIGIEYARVVDISGNFEIPRDFLEWKATCRHGDSNLLKYADDFLALNKKQYLYMFYVWGHSYEFPKDNNWNVIEEFCEKLGNRNDIWYATNIEIVDYLKACDNLQFSMNGNFVYNPSFQSVWLSVNSIIYEVPGGKKVSFE
ncbi:peptidoglycan-N-acetylmuramic acid deacetylase PdaC [Clostridium puniceum]|uniref:Peptidoglycan-N-acetylmuramic acid deacetylase PdaC n=1 Tax=Clostridium puniceum TaxID=29367 RepID=A0A1S8TC37_9CLOT|nr:polysaccharide deacetylase family protein [Clostridium puniceum]OOM75377.1 peptidoglycan-N-acetylmuramic acid deacetylase PdaC [Clostridium puniceum]